MEKIKVLIVDDHDIVLLGVKALLANYPEIDIIGTIKTGQEAIRQIATLSPDVVILDIDLPDMNGIEVAKNMLKTHPALKIIFHTFFLDEQHVVECFEVGAMGYVPKNFQPQEFVDAIKKVHSGERYLKGKVSEVFLDSFFSSKKEKEVQGQIANLTKREIEILKLVGSGVSNQEIAEKLFISIRTVEAHKSNIMGKLGISTTVELVKFAIKNKLVEL